MLSSLVFVCSIVGNGWFGPQKNTSNRVSSGPTYPTRDVRRVFVNILCLLKKRQKMRRHAASKFLHFKFRNPAPPTSPPMPSSALLGDAGGCTPGARLISSPPPPPWRCQSPPEAARRVARPSWRASKSPTAAAVAGAGSAQGAPSPIQPSGQP